MLQSFEGHFNEKTLQYILTQYWFRKFQKYFTSKRISATFREKYYKEMKRKNTL